jgi:hypothetical protein
MLYCTGCVCMHQLGWIEHSFSQFKRRSVEDSSSGFVHMAYNFIIIFVPRDAFSQFAISCTEYNWICLYIKQKNTIIIFLIFDWFSNYSAQGKNDL